LSVKFHDQPAPFVLAGVTVLKASPHTLKLEVDTTKVSIQIVMNEVLKAGDVADITIEDPPLEEVIAHIYSQPSNEQESPKPESPKEAPTKEEPPNK
jgi:ABC-2 type transport system ATP-binding protein